VGIAKSPLDVRCYSNSGQNVAMPQMFDKCKWQKFGDVCITFGLSPKADIECINDQRAAL